MESIGKLLEEILRHYERKEYGMAEKLVDDLLAGNPNFHRGWFLKGVILEEKGNIAEAEKCYAKAGNIFTLYFRLALQLQDVDTERAIKYYDRLSQMDPRNNMVWFNKGMIYEKIGKLDEAGKCFRNLSPAREIFSRILIPSGFMIFLFVGAVMMITRGDKTLSIIVIASALFCIFWLKRDAGTAIQMLLKKNKYK